MPLMLAAGREGSCDTDLSMKVPSIEGLVETALYVTDPTCSVKFYSEVLGFKPIDADERITAMSVGGRHVLLLCKKGASKDWSVPHDGDGELHVAFAIPLATIQVPQSRGFVGGDAGPQQVRDSDGGDDQDDHHHNQQLNQRKPPLFAVFLVPFHAKCLPVASIGIERSVS